MGNACGAHQRLAAVADSLPGADRTVSAKRVFQDCSGALTEYYIVDTFSLGDPAVATVSRATHKATGLERAVRTISKARSKSLARIAQEVSLMRTLCHPNIIRLFETFEDHRNVYLVLELARGGELLDRIIRAGEFTEVNAATVMKQVFASVVYLHEQHVAHRDLRPEIIMFESQDAFDKAQIKIIDFGSAKRVEPGEIMTTKTGAAFYTAPQVSSGSYTNACDVWSSGVIMYTLLCGYPPFYGENDDDIVKKVKDGKFFFNPIDWKHATEEAKDLVRAQLQVNPTNRITAAECLVHPWCSTLPDRPSRTSTTVANLSSFRSHNQLKTAAMQVIAKNLGEGELQQLKTVFASLDKNGDGSLTITELAAGLETSGLMGSVDLKEIMNTVDVDGSGRIDYTEFVAAAMDKQQYLREEAVWAAFRVFDKNGDGTITQSELKQVLESKNLDTVATRKQIQELLKEVDQNGDGQIDFAEFLEMMRRA